MKKLSFTLAFAFLVFTIKAQNVGIGEISPSSKLEIKTNSSVTYPQLTLMEDEDDYSRLTFSSTAQPDSFWTIAARPTTSSFGKMNFYYRSSGDLMTLTTDGNLGIGTTTPVVKLDVKNTQAGSLARFDGGNNMFMAISENGRYLGYWGSFSGAPDDIDFGTRSGSTAKLHLTTSAIPRLTIDKDGNVGVGTVAPQEKLDVNGNLNLDGSLKISGNAGTAGQVLTSTGSGAPEWRSMSSLPNIRFSVEFSNTQIQGPPENMTFGSVRYNTSPVDVQINTNSIHLSVPGMYHLDISFDYMNWTGTTGIVEFYLEGIFGSEDAYLLYKEHIPGNTRKNFYFPIDVYVDSPENFSLAVDAYPGAGGGTTLRGEIAKGTIRGYLISE